MTDNSTFKLIYGRSPCLTALGEIENIFHSVRSNNLPYTGGLFSSNKFWRYASQRFWSYDDFTYNKIASVRFLNDVNRFKISFNPFHFYCFIFIAKTDIPFDEKMCKEIVNQNIKILAANGLNISLYKSLEKCHVNRKWDNESWLKWNTEIINNEYISNTLDSIFYHEMQHVICNHLDRRLNKDSKLWNLATDFSINQSAEFDKLICKRLISTHNKTFFSDFKKGTVIYESVSNNDIKELLDAGTDVNKIFKTYIGDKIFNKSSDYYYNILLSTNDDVNYKDNYENENDSHTEWDDNKESNKETTSDGNNEKSDENVDGLDDGKASVDPGTNGNFDRNEFSEKAEAIGILKDTLQNCNIDIDDQNSIFNIPGMNINGYLIDRFNVKSTPSWKKILRKEILKNISNNKHEHTFKRESRIIEDLFPGKIRQKSLKVVFQTDSSGSISQSDWEEIISNVIEVCNSHNIKKVRCLQVTTKVTVDEFVKVNKLKKWRIKSTGGTIMASGLNYLKKCNNTDPVIILTDGYIDKLNPIHYPFNVIIFITGGNKNSANMISNWGFKTILKD